MTATRSLVAFAIGAVGVAVLLSRLPGDDTGRGDQLLPDLWSSVPFELQLGTIEERTVLRFTSEINNEGRGPLLLHGSTKDRDFRQVVLHSEAGSTELPLEVDIVWGGDTHFHWHVEDVARYWIEPVGEETLSDSFDNKVGFCFFDGVDRDSDLPGAPTEAVHPPEGCGSRLDPDIAMGLSVGWGDQYRFDLEGQFIDIEDLPTGQYRLVAEVDPDRRFAESDRTNNTASTTFTLIVDADGGRTLLG